MAEREGEPVPAFEVAARSITGQHRAVNEDAWGASPEHGVFVVADGCGGVDNGRAAADLAVATVGRQFASGATAFGLEPLVSAVHEANRAIEAAAAGARLGMCAALAAIRFAGPFVVAVNVGDCRVYRFRRSGPKTQAGTPAMVSLTTDDTLWLAMAIAGMPDESVREAQEQHRNVITQSLGFAPTISVHAHTSRHEPGDVFLLCSDGVTSQLTDATIVTILEGDGLGLDACCERLVQAADASRGADNVTAVLVRRH